MPADYLEGAEYCRSSKTSRDTKAVEPVSGSTIQGTKRVLKVKKEIVGLQRAEIVGAMVTNLYIINAKLNGNPKI